ncbi:MAG: type VI secretion system baseplate subunit TssF [Salinisphaera sp.]|nr:type VI secretion system baseplate subunit TssF [Salinisphaera sp.]
MDARLLHRYEEELRYMREMGAEFADAYPKVAGRLGMDGLECSDPYVERLLEGFAFLAARTQLKLDSQFPVFTQNLLDVVHPNLIRPTPSVAMVAFEPDLTEGALAEGFTVPRGSALQSLLGKGEKTTCEYRTAHDVALWPLQIESASYLPNNGAVAAQGLPVGSQVRAAIRIELMVSGDLALADLALDRLPIHLHGGDAVPTSIYEQIHANALGCYLRDAHGTKDLAFCPAQSIGQPGFERDQALLPPVRRVFEGYRLLQEYFIFPQRFLFFELTGLAEKIGSFQGNRLEIIIPLNRAQASLEHELETPQFRLFVTPAINLFPHTADRIHLTHFEQEFHVVPDRNRPMDFEVYDVVGLRGHGSSTEHRRDFLPLYGLNHHSGALADSAAFYTCRRRPREKSTRQKRQGTRSSYFGGECFIALSDPASAPFGEELRQLEVHTLCSNRDLPLHMAVGQGDTDFTLDSGAPVQAVRVIGGPTRPREAIVDGDTTWRIISQLSLNYLSLADTDDDAGAQALRELLSLYVDPQDPLARHIEGLRSVDVVSAVRRMPVPGPISFGHGVEITIQFEEAAFTGTGVFVLGAVLERFFAKYASMNAFTETVITTRERGQIMRWPARAGRRQLL